MATTTRLTFALVFGAALSACGADEVGIEGESEGEETGSTGSPGSTGGPEDPDTDTDGDGVDTDEDCEPITAYPDADGDGWGDGEGEDVGCEIPAGYAEEPGDCDDTDERFHPGAEESDCTDPNDYNCDGMTGYADADGDGFAACEDCNDKDEEVNPDAEEWCDGIDNDCDRVVDGEDGGGRRDVVRGCRRRWVR